MTQTTIELSPRPAARAELESRAKLLAQLGDGWHLAEFGIALGAGIAADSVALMSFASDSLVEVLGASAIGGGGGPTLPPPLSSPPSHSAKDVKAGAAEPASAASRGLD
jgi:hypothetical protein